MSANDYYEEIKKTNPKIVKGDKIIITPEELERHIKRAFNVGYSNGETSKSVFKQIFG